MSNYNNVAPDDTGTVHMCVLCKTLTGLYLAFIASHHQLAVSLALLGETAG